MAAILELTNFNDPNKVLVLSEATTIKVTGEVHLRAIHLDVGCESITLEGDGKLCLHPKSSDHVAIGIPALNVVKDRIWKVNDRNFNMVVRCAELSIQCVSTVQWFGVYGQFDAKRIQVSEGTKMPDSWQSRKAALFKIGSMKYFGTFTEFVKTPRGICKVKRIKKALTELHFEGIDFWTLLLLTEEEFYEKYMYLLIEYTIRKGGEIDVRLNKSSRNLCIMAIAYQEFYGKPMDRDFVCDCLALLMVYASRTFQQMREVQLALSVKCLRTIDHGDYTNFTLDAVKVIRTSDEKTPLPYDRIYLEEMDRHICGDCKRACPDLFNELKRRILGECHMVNVG